MQFFCPSPQVVRYCSSSYLPGNPTPSSSSSSNSCSPPHYSLRLNPSFRRRRHTKISNSEFKGIMKNLSFRAKSSKKMHRNPGAMTDVNAAPDHLLVLVHGIWASPADWTNFEADLERRLGSNFLIYVSSCNTYMKTLTGIDDSGKRLADEVMQVVRSSGSLSKISFLAHSLGGLIARYAIGVLYNPNNSPNSFASNGNAACSGHYGPIAGLEPINFITLATPHLGVRGNKQLPFLLGVPLLEKIVAPVAPIFVGTTGRQLFLTDGKPEKPPLLLRMTSDCDDRKFISALASFQYRVLYANVSYDHMVGWRTASVRRETELIKTPTSLDGYKHIVKVEKCLPCQFETPSFPPQAAKAKAAAQTEPTTKNTVKYHEIMEEEMIRGLQGLEWTKVDVNFGFTWWPFLAHSTIHVKNGRLHNAGAEVVAHVAHTIQQYDPSTPCSKTSSV